MKNKVSQPSRLDNFPFTLNPNCSEVIWRLKGHSQRHEGTNQLPFAVFINDIIRIFADLNMNPEQIARAEPIYIRGDGGPDTLEWSFKYAQDLVAGIRDPRELEHEEDLDNQIVQEGYDDEISQEWQPIVTAPRDPTKPLTKVEQLLDQIRQNRQGKKKSKPAPLRPRGTKKASRRPASTL